MASNIDKLNGIFDKLQKYVGTNNMFLEDTKNSLVEINDLLKNLINTKQQLELKEQDNNNEITIHTQNIADKSAELDACNAKLAGLESDLANLKNEKASLEEENKKLNELNATNASDNQRFEALNDELSTKKTEIETLKGEITTLKGEIETLNSKIRELNTEIENLTKENDILKDQIQSFDGIIGQIETLINSNGTPDYTEIKTLLDSIKSLLVSPATQTNAFGGKSKRRPKKSIKNKNKNKKTKKIRKQKGGFIHSNTSSRKRKTNRTMTSSKRSSRR